MKIPVQITATDLQHGSKAINKAIARAFKLRGYNNISVSVKHNIIYLQQGKIKLEGKLNEETKIGRLIINQIFDIKTKFFLEIPCGVFKHNRIKRGKK